MSLMGVIDKTIEQALTASQARVAELEAESAAKDAALNALREELETTKYQLGNLSKQWPELLRDGQRYLTEANEEYARRVSAETALNALRVALEKARPFLSYGLTLGDMNTAREIVDAALSLEAVKLAADAQARRDEAVAEAVRLIGEVRAHLSDIYVRDEEDAFHPSDTLNDALAALAKVKP